MPGVKGRSGRKQANPLNDCTPYMMRKAWAAFDKKLASLEIERPSLWAEIQQNKKHGISNEFAGDIDFAREEKAHHFTANTAQGRTRENHRRAIAAIGTGRVRHAVNSESEAIALAALILRWHEQGKTKSHIALLATRKADKAISAKAISKLLGDYAEKSGRA